MEGEGIRLASRRRGGRGNRSLREPQGEGSCGILLDESGGAGTHGRRQGDRCGSPAFACRNRNGGPFSRRPDCGFGASASRGEIDAVGGGRSLPAGKKRPAGGGVFHSQGEGIGLRVGRPPVLGKPRRQGGGGGGGCPAARFRAGGGEVPRGPRAPTRSVGGQTGGG